jgi:hypothetical protein
MSWSGTIRQITGCGALTASLTSWPVTTAKTPGWASALDTSMLTIRACGTGLRSTAASSIPGSRISSAN